MAAYPSFGVKARTPLTVENNTSTLPQPVSALTMIKQRRTRPRLFLLRNGTFELDIGITEIAGIAGSGKTQIVLGLCVLCACSTATTEQCSLSPADAQRQQNQPRPYASPRIRNPYAKPKSTTGDKENVSPQNYYKALYVSMGEGGTHAKIAKRLGSMTEHQKCGNVLERVLTRIVRNQEEFMELVHKELPRLLRESSDIGLVALDSIAGLFRVPDAIDDNAFYATRCGVLFEVASQLKRLSDAYKVPMVVVNQVTASFSCSEANQVVPALGVTWANCVNTSYLVKREETWTNSNMSTVESGQTKFARTLTLCRSSKLPVSSVAFTIDAGGPLAQESRPQQPYSR